MFWVNDDDRFSLYTSQEDYRNGQNPVARLRWHGGPSFDWKNIMRDSRYYVVDVSDVQSAKQSVESQMREYFRSLADD